MKKFVVNVSRREYGTYEIEVEDNETIEDAFQKAKDIPWDTEIDWDGRVGDLGVDYVEDEETGEIEMGL